MVQFMESTKLSTQSLWRVWGLFTNKDFSVFKEPPIKIPSHGKDTSGHPDWGCKEIAEDASREAVAKLPWLDLQTGAGRRDGHCPWC